MNTKKLLIYSGIFSVCFYFVLLFFLIFGFNFSNPVKYIFKADTQMDQVMDIDALLEDSVDGNDTQESGNPLEGSGIKDVFSSIDSQVSQNEEIADNREQVAKNLKLNKQRKQALNQLQNNIKEINSKLQNIKNITIDIGSQSPKPDTSDGLYDEWFSQVYKILYSKWKISFYQNASVSVLLTITDTGDFSYKILRYSRYDDYNKSVENLLKSLSTEKFPSYPKGKFVSIEVNFKTEEKQ